MILRVCFWVCLMFCAKRCNGTRRMWGGAAAVDDQEFMVYLVRSPRSVPKYDAWLCTGCIVAPTKVLTSAACLATVTHPYVIAGYRHYVNGRAIQYDPCTRRRKRRVVTICVPKDYEIESTQTKNASVYRAVSWSRQDIGVAVVHRSFEFDDITWKIHCSWVPAPIRISYNSKLRTGGVDAVVYGWGGYYYRDAKDLLDPNSHNLQEILTVIAELNDCDFGNLAFTVVREKWMICVNGSGNIRSNGEMIRVGDRTRSHWDITTQSTSTTTMDGSLRLTGNTNNPSPAACAGDHGAPLVTWEGSERVVVGVALVSRYLAPENRRCLGPTLFTSTYCTGLILDCMLRSTPTSLRSCEILKERKEAVEERNVDWGKTD